MPLGLVSRQREELRGVVKILPLECRTGGDDPAVALQGDPGIRSVRPCPRSPWLRRRRRRSSCPDCHPRRSGRGRNRPPTPPATTSLPSGLHDQGIDAVGDIVEVGLVTRAVVAERGDRGCRSGSYRAKGEVPAVLGLAHVPATTMSPSGSIATARPAAVPSPRRVVTMPSPPNDGSRAPSRSGPRQRCDRRPAGKQSQPRRSSRPAGPPPRTLRRRRPRSRTTPCRCGRKLGSRSPGAAWAFGAAASRLRAPILRLP